jgi:hypothetical protein
MANRSYLYSTNVVPGTDAKRTKHRIVGISEWDYGIPIVYKLLLTGNPRTCRSSIWEVPDHIALVGDYSLGLQRLKQLLKRIGLPAAQSSIDEALVFLEKEDNRKEYFLLECGEIFDMTAEPMEKQNSTLLEEIKNLDTEIEEVLSGLPLLPVKQPKARGLLATLVGVQPSRHDATFDARQVVSRLGLGNWSNNLYYDPNMVWQDKGR